MKTQFTMGEIIAFIGKLRSQVEAEEILFKMTKDENPANFPAFVQQQKDLSKQIGYMEGKMETAIAVMEFFEFDKIIIENKSTGK